MNYYYLCFLVLFCISKSIFFIVWIVCHMRFVIALSSHFIFTLKIFQQCISFISYETGTKEMGNENGWRPSHFSKLWPSMNHSMCFIFYMTSDHRFCAIRLIIIRTINNVQYCCCSFHAKGNASLFQLSIGFEGFKKIERS